MKIKGVARHFYNKKTGIMGFKLDNGLVFKTNKRKYLKMGLKCTLDSDFFKRNNNKRYRGVKKNAT